MKKEISDKFRDLKRAKHDFVKTTYQANARLAMQHERLVERLKRSNARVRRHQEVLKRKSMQLSSVSKARAEKTHSKLSHQIDRIRTSIGDAKREAHSTRAELRKVKRDLVSAKNHLSHAMHVDKAFEKIDAVLAKRQSAKKQSE